MTAWRFARALGLVGFVGFFPRIDYCLESSTCWVRLVKLQDIRMSAAWMPAFAANLSLRGYNGVGELEDNSFVFNEKCRIFL